MEQRPNIPGGPSSLIYISPNFAERTLDERRDDAVAVTRRGSRRKVIPMITRYAVDNFKAFATTQPISIRPITLIFGANSSGKSSFIHSLLLAHEGIHMDNFDPHFTRLGGKSVDLGGFSRFVHKHETDNHIVFSFGLKVEEESYKYRFVPDKRSTRENVEKRLMSTELHYRLEVGPIPQHSPTVKRKPQLLHYRVRADGKALFSISAQDLAYPPQHVNTFNQTLYISDINFNHPVTLYLFKNIFERHGIIESEWNAFATQVVELLKALEVLPGDLSFPSETTNIYDDTFAINNAHLVSDRCSAVLQAVLQREEFQYFDLETYLDHLQRSSQKLRERQASDFEDDDLPVEEVKYSYASMPSIFEEFPELVEDESFIHELWEARNRGARIAQDVMDYMGELFRSTLRILTTELGSLQYLGPLRSYPDRIMQSEYGEDLSWRAVGGYAWQDVQNNESLRQKVNRWLGSDFMKTGYRLESRQLYVGEELLTEIERSDPSSTFSEVLRGITPAASELSLVDLKTGTRVSHRDIGVGVSQVLPVLATAYGSEQKLIMVEQPELHLHPGLQAQLGDVFIESALGSLKNQFLLETHSEHLILRIMRRIRETTDGTLPAGIPAIRPEDVTILYAESTPRGSVIRQIQLDDEGQLVDAWPGGFFEEGFQERFA